MGYTSSKLLSNSVDCVCSVSKCADERERKRERVQQYEYEACS